MRAALLLLMLEAVSTDLVMGDALIILSSGIVVDDIIC
jgi:hypothetical protein